jgi:single stranded DNA-binding protein
MQNRTWLLPEKKYGNRREGTIENVNLVQLLGQLERDPEVRLHHRGKLVRMHLLTTEVLRNEKGKWTNNMQRHRLTAWGACAEMASSRLTKGQVLYIEGRLVHNTFNDKRGTKRLLTEVKVRVIKVLA